MRHLFAFSLLFLSLQFAAATPVDKKLLINKEWIGPGGEYLHISDDSLQLETSFDNGKKAYMLIGSTLEVPVFQYGSDHRDYSYVDSFVIDEINKDILVIRSVRKIGNLRNEFRSGKPMIFVNRTTTADSSFRFQKIFYAFSNSWGGCRGTQVSVDSTGMVLFAANTCGKFNGTYKGQLTALQLKKLNEDFYNSMPDRFALPCCAEDGGSVTFKFYYNNKIKKVYGQYPVPYLAQKLADFLQLISGKVPLEKVSDNTTLE